MVDLTQTQAIQAVYDRFKTQWESARPGVRYGFDDEAFKPPASGPWVRFTIRHLSRVQVTLGEVGHRIYDSRAQVMVQTFNDRDKGRETNDLYAGTIRDIFEGASFGGIICEEMTTREVGAQDKWYQLNCVVPFRYSETR